MAIWAFALGITGIVLCGFTSFIAIPLGGVALNQINTQVRNGQPVEKGRWMAVTGLVLGVLGTIFVVVSLLAVGLELV